MISISVKELRERLPVVRKHLKKGMSFLVIYQSKPIAKLTPIDSDFDFEEAKDEEIEQALLVDAGEEDFLDEKELKYYLELK